MLKVLSQVFEIVLDVDTASFILLAIARHGGCERSIEGYHRKWSRNTTKRWRGAFVGTRTGWFEGIGTWYRKPNFTWFKDAHASDVDLALHELSSAQSYKE